MIVLVNFNNYLGGGETLLLRIAEKIGNKKSIVLGSKGSYIESEVTGGNGRFFEGNYNYHYLDASNKCNIFQWIEGSLPSGALKIVTFCMRDLHIMNDLMLSNRMARPGYSITHLLLHPLDHLYLCQNLQDKFWHWLLGNENYSQRENVQANTNLLAAVAESDSLIPMNINILNRFRQDTNINLNQSTIVPLPCYISSNKKREVACQIEYPLKIVWMGRIVDFKLPAILAMIDVIANTQGVEFYIIGYGNERAVKKYIKKKNVGRRVKLVGKVKPGELPAALSKYDIGYAMGTSLVELTAHGLPTIVALAKPNFRRFRKPICAGLVFEQMLGNVGDDLYACGVERLPTIEEKINEILASPEKVLEKSTSCIGIMFDFDCNIDKYLDVILNSKQLESPFPSLMKISPLKKLMFKLV